MTEHTVIVEFTYHHTDLTPLRKLAETLGAAIHDSGVGEYDGNEFATDGSD